MLGYSSNIIGTKLGTDKSKKIILSAHYDTVQDTVGVIDNASGVATILEVARCIQNYDLPYSVEIIF